ncbi:anaerobic dimethyl sulfoxide reductase subunit A [Acetitomaculum ruminis DSM 5522]|uniref:Anaerobic dimethyl sulfoxide reductase subunit A n=1 Tax=Acetitomaculum ruminis DSM 5522 TaxID=1120918 RepID=A0A1I0XZS3_9FIRM|nr:DMSO/selenate family reductase complex A subunit [Acetitomaculum ruminis]SFB05860.1 anaerobic dimethyl sulfoxide reductase subunit A [Acetitomaculum ruminis DSM 5522]
MEKTIKFLFDIYDFLQDCESDPRAFSAIFEGTNANINIPLWESAYKNNMNIILDSTSLSVKKAYFKAGLCPKDKNNPCDDIFKETEFLLYLSLKSRDWELFISFFNRHYRDFLAAFLKKILEFYPLESHYEKKSKEFLEILYNQDFQTEFSQLNTKKILDNDLLLDFSMENKSNELLMDKIKSFKASHFEKISLKDIERELEEKEVITCGINNCGGKCRINARVTSGCITKLSTDLEDERGNIKACVRGRGYRRTFLSSQRLRYPLKRVGKRGQGLFERISWEEALDIMEEKIKSITAKYGYGCRYVNYSTGVTSKIRGDRLAKRFFALTGGYLDYFNSYSGACFEYTTPFIYGTDQSESSPDTYLDTKLLVLWGHNPLVTMWGSEYLSSLKKIKEKNIPIVVIDPQFSDTAAVFAAKWIPIKPGTDAALALSIAYVLISKKLYNKAFLTKYCQGFDKTLMPKGFENEESFEEYVMGIRDGIEKNPAWASKLTGISPEDIYDLALKIAKAKPCAILPGNGLQRTSNGESSLRCIQALSAMTGNIGIRGGSAATRGYGAGHKTPSFPMVKNPYGLSIPSFLWTDAVFRGKEMTSKKDHIKGGEVLESNIKILFNLAGNTLINQHGNVNRTREILADESLCEFIVCSDLFMTSSAKYADLLLPAPSLFEREFITAPWHFGNFLLYGNKCIDPLFECRFEFDWLYELAKRFGIQKEFACGFDNENDWNKDIYENLRKTEAELPDFDTFKKNGGYKYKNNPSKVAFKEIIEDFENNKFPTPSGKIELFSLALHNFNDPKIPAIPKFQSDFEGVLDEKIKQYPLQLIGWHTKRRCHSIHDNNEWMEEIEPHRLWINEKDAKKRAIKEGDFALIYNDRGKVCMKAHLTKKIMEGVVCIPQGAWFNPDEKGIDTRGCVNTLTTHEATPLAKGNSQHSCLVEVTLI